MFVAFNSGAALEAERISIPSRRPTGGGTTSDGDIGKTFEEPPKSIGSDERIVIVAPKDPPPGRAPLV